MKIAFVLDDSLDPPDGVQQYVISLGREFSRRGHDVFYLVGETARTDLPHVISLSRVHKFKFNGNSVRTPSFAKSSVIRDILIRETFDVVHVQLPFSPLLSGKVISEISQLNMAKKPKLVGTFHVTPNSLIAEIGGKALRPFIANNLAKFDAITSVSTVAQTFAEKLYRTDSVVIPCPINIAEFRHDYHAELTKFQIKSSAKVILFFGRLDPRKGPLEFINALNLAQKNRAWPKNVRVLMAGAGGSLYKKSVQHAKDLHTGIEFLGRVSEQEKIALLSRADVAVFPSLAGESFGIVLTEAMAAGAKVVLAGDNPGYRSTMFYSRDEVLSEPEKTARERALFAPQNSVQFAEKVLESLNDDAFTRTTHAWQQAHVTQFDVTRVADQLLALYHKQHDTMG
jgi:phosphatidylinositol alpha-mannosyltransferase